ncbi:hypothetical protein ACQKNX_08280 [Lysinibacillus sp. NPDC093712]|uniref:hypothetical protein n=1 Tax=Lysinibacillus sp. NPDC093712 TaxID=3390579 RepID=UPI003D0212EB
MKYQVKLNSGDKFNVVDEYFNVIEFTERMNNQQILFVSIGGSSLNKHTVVSVIPMNLITNNESTE